MRRAAPLPAGVTRRRSCQHIARSQQVDSATDYPCTVSAPTLYGYRLHRVFSVLRFFVIVVFPVLSCLLFYLQSIVLFVMSVYFFAAILHLVVVVVVVVSVFR